MSDSSLLRKTYDRVHLKLCVSDTKSPFLFYLVSIVQFRLSHTLKNYVYYRLLFITVTSGGA